MKTHEELKKEFAEKWSQFGMQEGLKKALEKDILFDLNVLLDKLMPTEEDAQNEALRRYTSNTGYLQGEKLKAFVKGTKWICNYMKGENNAN